MEVNVDQDLCISCGLCVNQCPDIFDWNKDGKADATNNPVPVATEDCCREAIGDCPTVAIKEA